MTGDRAGWLRILLARRSVLSHNFTAISEAGISLFKKREEREEDGERKKKKEKSGRGREKITFFSEGNERALWSTAAAARSRRRSGENRFLCSQQNHQVSLELEKNLSNRVQCERSLPPSFTPIIAGAGTRENNVKRGKKGRTKEIGTVRVFTRLLDSSLPIFEVQSSLTSYSSFVKQDSRDLSELQ